MIAIEPLSFIIGFASGVACVLVLAAVAVSVKNAGRYVRTRAALQGAAATVASAAAPVGVGAVSMLLAPGESGAGANPSIERCAVDSGSPEIAATRVARPTVMPRAEIIPLRPAGDHARALLDWLQGPGGLTGEITASEMEAIYNDMICELRWGARPWAPVASELRKLLGGEKFYGYRAGARVRVWRIPGKSTAAPMRKAA